MKYKESDYPRLKLNYPDCKTWEEKVKKWESIYGPMPEPEKVDEFLDKYRTIGKIEDCKDCKEKEKNK